MESSSGSPYPNRAADFDALLTRLHELATVAQTPEAQRQAGQLLERAGEQIRHWIDYNALVWQADQAGQRGDWTQAIALLESACRAPADGQAPAWARANLERVREAAAAIRQAEQVARALLRAVRQQYQQASTTQDLAKLHRALDAVNTQTQMAVEAALAAGGTPSPAIGAMRQEAAELRRIAEWVQRALAQPAPDERLSTIQSGLTTLGAEPILIHFEALLAQAFQQQVPELLAQAVQAQRRGEWAAALGLLGRVLAHAPQHPAAKAQVAVIEAQQRCEAWIDEVEQALARTDLARALTTLARAAASPGDTIALARFDLLRETIGTLRDTQQELNKRLQQAVKLLVAREYDDAERELATAMERCHDLETQVETLAQRLRPDADLRALRALPTAVATQIGRLQHVADAGHKLHTAIEIWALGKNLEQGRELLALARHSAGDDPQFSPLTTEIDFYLGIFEAHLAVIDEHLRAARHALARRDLAAAQDAIRLVLADDPHHPQARQLALQVNAQIRLARREQQVESLLRQITYEHQQGNHEQAGALLRQLLSIAPEHVEARRLQSAIEHNIEANQAVNRALELLYRRNFRKAAEQLAEAARLRVDPSRLREVRQIFDEMKSDYRAAHIFVIRDLLRKERYLEALRRVREEQKKDLDDDLNAELNDLRIEIERRWPDQALAWSDAQLRLARTEADYEALEAVLQQVLAQLSDFPQRAQVEHQFRQIVIARLNHSLQLIELALQHRLAAPAPPASNDTHQQLEQAPQSIEDARRRAEAVAAAAREMGLRSLMERAERLLGALSLQAGAAERTTTPLHDDPE